MQSKVNPGANCLSNQMTKPPNYIWDRDLESHPVPDGRPGHLHPATQTQAQGPGLRRIITWFDSQLLPS